jgi:hypothetical protein
MSVFYRGFYDAFTRHLSGAGKKRKFIELYLYAQGMIYADFIGSLKTVMRKAGQPEDLKTQAPLDLAGKMNLLYELGILDFLTNRYSNSGSGLSFNDLAELISQIMGEPPEQKEKILYLIKKMSQNNITTTFHRSMAAD